MKNTIKITLATILFVACSDDFIELSPISEGNAENFYKVPSDFESAIIGAYSNLASEHQYGSEDSRFGGSFYALMEVRADDVADGAASGSGKAVFDIDKFQDNPLSGVIEGAWTSIFKTIFDSNAIISRIENITIDNALKNQYLAEARFLRALAYFNAVRLWGDLPIVLKEITPQEAKDFSRKPVSEVYKIIKEDLTFASKNLPTSLDAGRASSGAANALLGKVYLTLKDWNNAVSTLTKLIGKDYELLPNIADVFELGNENNKEILFAVKFKSNNNNLGHLGFGTPKYPDLLTKYDASDTRLPLLDMETNDNGSYPKKQIEISDGRLGRDFPVIRYADVLLMLSEALNEVEYQASGDAFTYLNQVRSRAGISNYTATDLATQEAFRNAVLNERRLELPLELHRWFDLLRTDNAIQALSSVGITVQSYQLLYPIPQNEINVYNNSSQFPQNPRY